MAEKKNALCFKLMAIMLVALVGVVCINVVPAFANNHGDTRFARYTDNSGGDYITPGREKQDYTSCYTYNDQSWCSYRAQGVGRWSESGNYYTNATLDMTWVDVGYAKYIAQNVKELGYWGASLLVTPAPHSASYLSFLWSPDSI